MNKEVKNDGFSSEKEENFLKRLPSNLRRENLSQELKTQLAEDFGIVQFTLKYKFNHEDKIVDIISGQEVVELTSRGGIEEETESIRKIEDGLKNNSEQTWIGFSPKNEKLGYPNNCVDFWRVVDGIVVWNRIVVKNNFNELNKTRSFLSGEKEVKDNWEILRSPIAVEDLKLAEISDFFVLNESKNFNDLGYIERVVDKYLSEFENDFGEKVTADKKLIFRLYSACFNALKYRENDNEVIVSRYNLENYMYGIMNEVRIEKSGGCAATTTVGSFGEKIGYFILPNGEVVKGEIPKGYKECKKCGYWYEGDKCPFC
jgi:hypothetical protein